MIYLVLILYEYNLFRLLHFFKLNDKIVLIIVRSNISDPIYKIAYGGKKQLYNNDSIYN